ncbi:MULTISPECIES: hypothetical protein [unclassified Paenibacillus]|nr:MULTISPECIES: hypothetical protein [unclassified Paenibacillus]
MSKLVIAVLLTVLVAGAALYTVGGQLAPAAGTAGNQTKLRIQDAFE